MSGPAADRAIAALEARGHVGKWDGAYWRTWCTHAGADNKTAMWLFDNGERIKFGCFTRTCTSDEIRESLGLSIRDMYNKREPFYRYDDGRVVHREWREQEQDMKGFRQSGNKDGVPILYRRAEILEAVADGKVIYLCEGEPDAHSLVTVGLAATSGPGGAGNFGNVDVEPLRGASVVAVVDRDERGDQWAALVAEKLRGVGAEVTFRRAAYGKDADDHVAADLKVDDLVPYRTAGGEPVTDVTDSSAHAGEPIDGAALLDEVEQLLSRYVVYPGEHERVAHVLWIAHTHLMGCWESTPRIAFLSPEPGSGKSRALEVTEPLTPRPVHAVNATPAYLFRKVSDPAGPPTILFDEIDTIFGPKAKDNEELRGMLNAGHRRGAMAGRCVIRGREVHTEELPAYAAVALAGLDDLPDTLMSRSVIVRMRRRARGERVEPWRLRTCGPEAVALGDTLAAWALSAAERVGWPEMPEGVEDRAADVWEALLAVADVAGGDWPTRARDAAISIVTRSAQRPPSLGVLLLRDLRQVFSIAGADRLPTEDILAALVALDESPWADLRGQRLDARGLSRRLAKYDVRPRILRRAGLVFRGYDAADLADAWDRYLADEPRPSGAEHVTSVTPVTPRQADVTDVTDVTRSAPHGGDADPLPLSVDGFPSLTPLTVEPCPKCGEPNEADRAANGLDCLTCKAVAS